MNFEGGARGLCEAMIYRNASSVRHVTRTNCINRWRQKMVEKFHKL